MLHIRDLRTLGIRKTVIGHIGEHGPLAERSLFLGHDQPVSGVDLGAGHGNNNPGLIQPRVARTPGNTQGLRIVNTWKGRIIKTNIGKKITFNICGNLKILFRVDRVRDQTIRIQPGCRPVHRRQSINGLDCDRTSGTVCKIKGNTQRIAVLIYKNDGFCIPRIHRHCGIRQLAVISQKV